MREIVLDTETTGLSPKAGHKIIEIGCVEMINQIATGENFHQYINPHRDIPEEAFSIHGLSEEFLSDKPDFAQIADSLLEFLGDAQLIIHNAEFDINFINSELQILGRELLSMDRATDTARLARARFPGSPVNLDALCRRFQIDISNRELHGALLDAQLLASVYLELIGGRQRGLSLQTEDKIRDRAQSNSKESRPKRPHAASDAELSAHADFISRLEKPVWTH